MNKLITLLITIEIMKVQSDDNEFYLSSDYKYAIKQLMIQCILMMRKQDPKYAECWYYGACKITDFMASNGHVFQYGGADSKYLTEGDCIWVKVPFEVKENPTKKVQK